MTIACTFDQSRAEKKNRINLARSPQFVMKELNLIWHTFTSKIIKQDNSRNWRQIKYLRFHKIACSEINKNNLHTKTRKKLTQLDFRRRYSVLEP